MTILPRSRLLTAHQAMSDEAFVPLPLAALGEVGAAAQTLGAIQFVCSASTFVGKQKIIDVAGVSRAAFWRHVEDLVAAGWLENHGRQRTATGWLRRTSTLQLTRKAIADKQPFLRLPWWATAVFRSCPLPRQHRLPWAAKATLAWCVSRYTSLWAVATNGDAPDLENIADYSHPDEFLPALAEEFPDRFEISAPHLARQLGLSPKAVRDARRLLGQVGLLSCQGGVWLPNERFAIAITDLPNGRCWLDVVLQPPPAARGLGA